MKAEEAGFVGSKVRVRQEHRILERRGMVGMVVGRYGGGRVCGRRRAPFGWTASAVLAWRSGGDLLTTAFFVALCAEW